MLPPTIPNLPVSFLPTEKMAAIRALLLGGEHFKIEVVGQGGSGKTSIAASTVRNVEIRQAFNKIMWVTIGQGELNSQH